MKDRSKQKGRIEERTFCVRNLMAYLLGLVMITAGVEELCWRRQFKESWQKHSTGSVNFGGGRARCTSCSSKGTF
jgi:hypothetical protein